MSEVTKEEILQELAIKHCAQENEISYNMAIEAMEIWAQIEVNKNLHKPAVIKSVCVCEDARFVKPEHGAIYCKKCNLPAR